MFAVKTDITTIRNIKKWRSQAFTLVAGLFTLALLVAGCFEFIPAWVFRNPNDDIHLWHIAELTALAAFFLGGVTLMLVRHPEKKPLLAQFLVPAGVILAVGIMPFEIKAAGLFILIGLFVAVYPDTRALLSFSREGAVSKPLLGLTLLMSLFLLPIAFTEVQWQIVGMAENDVHALQLHWIGSAVLMVLLLLAGVLSSTKRPGWKQLSVITGVTYCYLGVIAMILQDGYAGSWSGGRGVIAIIAGIWYILLMVLEAQRTKHEPAITQENVPASSAISQEALPVRRTRQLAEV